jgi:hypothetical protein
MNSDIENTQSKNKTCKKSLKRYQREVKLNTLEFAKEMHLHNFNCASQYYTTTYYVNIFPYIIFKMGKMYHAWQLLIIKNIVLMFLGQRWRIYDPIDITLKYALQYCLFMHWNLMAVIYLFWEGTWYIH